MNSISQFIREQLRTVGARLMLLYLLLLLVPVIGIGIYGHLYIQSALTRNAIELGLDEVVVRASTIDTLLGQIHDDIIYLQKQFNAEETTITHSEIDDLLKSLSETHQIYHSIAWFTFEGELIAGDILESLARWAEGNNFRVFSALESNTVRFIPLRAVSQNDQIKLITGVKLDTGILLFDINTGYLLESLTDTRANNEWGLLIQPNTILTATTDIFSANLGLDQIEGTRGYVPVNDRINFYHDTGPGGTWMIIHSVPRTQIEADLVQYYTTFFIIAFGGLTSVVGLALLSIARIIGPVYQLEEMVDQLRQGIARPTLPENLPEDEFGKLMTAFDQMADELEQKRRTERALIEQLIRAQEEERKLIAYDLHDGLIQELVGARFYLGEIREKCVDLSERTGESFLRGYDILSHAIVEGRRIIQGLHPTILEDLGLEAALHELAKTMASQASWHIKVDIETLNNHLSRATNVILYRITQEALNNAFKHANATNVSVTLRIVDNQLRLTIRDDGRGFDPDHIFQNGGKHWGIRTMKERTTMLRGITEIMSEIGEGTTIQVTIPYQPDREQS